MSRARRLTTAVVHWRGRIVVKSRWNVELLSEYGLFLAKIATVVIAIAVIAV
jgi:hypothetical protein